MPQDSAAFRVDEGDYAAQVGRFGETTLPVFLPAYPDRSGVGTPNGKSRFLVRVPLAIRRNDKPNTREVGAISRRVSRDERMSADLRMRSDVEIR